MMSCTSFTSSQSGSSLAQAMLRFTFSGFADEKRVPAMRGLLTEYWMARFDGVSLLVAVGGSLGAGFHQRFGGGMPVGHAALRKESHAQG